MVEHATDNREQLARLRSAAAQIARVREAEKEGGYSVSRNGEDYLEVLNGLARVFDYTRTLESNAVLDIGSGNTLAAYELAKSFMGRELTFHATGLVRSPKVDIFLGDENFTITPAEALRGVSDKSVGCVLGVFSITYSHDPEMVVDSIDRVLVDGGVVKAAFRPSRDRFGTRLDNQVFNNLDAKTGSEFQNLFDKKGYTTHLENMRSRDVLLAMKGNFPSSTISRLINDHVRVLV